MFRRIFFWGLTAGILSAVASIIYKRIYEFAYEVTYAKIINIPILVGANLIACLVAAIGFWACFRLFSTKGEIIFNFIFSIGSFASVMLPISAKLPLDVQFPEMFPLLTVPMHFFPVIAWFTIRPLFANKLFIPAN